MAEWSFLTNHLHALYCVASHPGIRIREIAESVGVQERTAHRIVADLVESGYLTRRRVGRRNYYELHPDQPLRREGLDEIAVGEILDLLLRRKREAIPVPMPALNTSRSMPAVQIVGGSQKDKLRGEKTIYKED